MNIQRSAIASFILCVLCAGCHIRPAVSVANAGDSTTVAASRAGSELALVTFKALSLIASPDASADVDMHVQVLPANDISTGPRIIRESVDGRCFGDAPPDSIEPVACPGMLQPYIVTN